MMGAAGHLGCDCTSNQIIFLQWPWPPAYSLGEGARGCPLDRCGRELGEDLWGNGDVETRWFRGSGGMYSKSLKSGVMRNGGQTDHLTLTLTQATRQTSVAISFYESRNQFGLSNQRWDIALPHLFLCCRVARHLSPGSEVCGWCWVRPAPVGASCNQENKHVNSQPPFLNSIWFGVK